MVWFDVRSTMEQGTRCKMSLIENEQTKLTAAYLNGIAIAVLAVGGLAPIVASFAPDKDPETATFIIYLICVLISAALHWAARIILKGLKP